MGFSSWALAWSDHGAQCNSPWQRIFRPYRAFVFFGAEPRLTLRSTLGYPISPLWGLGRVDCSPMGLVGKRGGEVSVGFVGGVSLMKRLPEARNGAHAIAHGREYFVPTGLLFFIGAEPRVTLRSTLGYPISPLWGLGRVDCVPVGLVGKRGGEVSVGFVGGVFFMGVGLERPWGAMR